LKYKIVLSLFILISLITCNTKQENSDLFLKISLWQNKTNLRGINIWQKKIDPEVDENFVGPGKVGPPFTQEDFNILREMGVNYVNISHPGIFNVNPPYDINYDILNNLKSLVEKIRNADMFCVISFRTGPGRSEYTFYRGEDYESDPENGWFDKKYYNDDVWESSELQEKWAEMWKKTADIFKNYDNVVGYDLMVEPNSNSVFFEIDDPETFYENYSGTLYDWNIFYTKLVSAIRESDSETPILISSLNWGSINWLSYIQTIDSPNLIYTVHQYDPYIYTHNINPYSYPDRFDINYDGITDDFNYQWLKSHLNKIQDFMNKEEVMIGINEYGVIRWVKNAKDFLDDEMSIFEELGVNYAIWAYSTQWEPYRTEIDEFNYLFGIDKNNKTEDYNNPLISALKKYWNKNTIFPSTINQ